MLKRLELVGFKSFADRLRFDFAAGITGVVGPNGSGKSNVVDSIKWILGDQSAKSLRGKEMTDVIFNGASGRKPSAFAEATLTFDNSTGFLPVETAEVQVGRRTSRSACSASSGCGTYRCEVAVTHASPSRSTTVAVPSSSGARA